MEDDMKMKKLVGFCIMVPAVAIIFGVHPSTSSGQETSSTGDILAPANQMPLPPYVNAGKGYEIGGKIVLAEPGGVSSENIALGYQALHSNTTNGIYNTAIGYTALYSNTTGLANAASGYHALFSNTTGSYNSAGGGGALGNNTTGTRNTASGYNALVSNTTGSYNTGSGLFTLNYNTTGSYNAAIGYNACSNIVTGSNVTCVGANTGPSGDISGPATYIAGIYGEPTGGSGNPLVCIDSTGLLGTVNCASNSAPSVQQEAIERQQRQIQRLQKQNAEFQQRLSRLEALLAQR
jgi:hypothetical protein